MTGQEVFDRVVAHLRAQGEKAISGTGLCLYRGADGRKCAVGCLIPDELYTPAVEGEAVDGPYMKDLLREIGVRQDLALGLQQVHDRFPVCRWEWALERLAVRYGLAYTPPAEGGAA